jgi:negative regulator of flagellin synthesis FlgM
MKILPGSQQTTPAEEKTDLKPDKTGAAPAKQAGAKTSRSSDRIDFSASLTASLKERQDRQAERIESIRSRIKAGTYQVSSQDVAEKMLSNPFEF